MRLMDNDTCSTRSRCNTCSNCSNCNVGRLASPAKWQRQRFRKMLNARCQMRDAMSRLRGTDVPPITRMDTDYGRYCFGTENRWLVAKCLVRIGQIKDLFGDWVDEIYTSTRCTADKHDSNDRLPILRPALREYLTPFAQPTCANFGTTTQANVEALVRQYRLSTFRPANVQRPRRDGCVFAWALILTHRSSRLTGIPPSFRCDPWRTQKPPDQTGLW